MATFSAELGGIIQLENEISDAANNIRSGVGFPAVIWIPITQDDASWSTEYEQQCHKLSFFWLNDPQKMMRPQFTRFVKEELFQMGLGEEPIIVSLDSEKEKLLWQQQTAWTLHLLAPQSGYYYRIVKPINDWIREEKYIFLYGGNNIKWIREFLSKSREVASKTQMNFELAYFGKNKMIRGFIYKESLSYCPLYDSSAVWWFWARLRSMFLSRIQYLEMTNHLVKENNNDEILQGFKKLLSYESKNATTEGWVLLSKGSEVVVCRHGSKMLQAMNDYEIWKENIDATKSFGQALKDHHEMLSKDKHSCCTLEYLITLSKIPKNKRCPECSRCMQKFLTFTCCHGDD
ncbi:PREDICTED: protein SIEVE ELEMENT OCCLUSION B-like [Ipomoea nil]|uniref:protein SIEVE ELEMENT OCCLUSION B-like n=1 Tax=Ipomoea nil TaxID=35883 RepID=UPI000901F6E0|nr:PREDICTED: protein SIEVE ELEMENT OCCLUSION B-like [Ipomoea nil]